ncbi:XRE family transcriptional regulator [Streptomyces sp. P38-E01]|uniref:XRE family transcriptional regulator n=1 Tax=Streptomyces tardus TaxID=2780544 RepID=A0A949JBZ7_9ACTN|nr:XRE family transcriptional regulator [Streptomyces tardus]MBU7597026.1 XRE family transcriptional regulator [Streptomyces tardus]
MPRHDAPHSPRRHSHPHGGEAADGTEDGPAAPAASAVEPEFDAVLSRVGPRLRALRQERDLSLADLSEVTGISKSTLSRLESGLRRPSLELLLPLAHAHRVPLDELVGAPETGDPRVRLRAQQFAGGRTVVHLTRQPGGLQAYKMVLPGERSEPTPMTHEGFEWLYVLAGRLRLVLAEHDLTMGPGEAAEFDTRLPHWFGSADGAPVELLSLFGQQGERIHVSAKPREAGRGSERGSGRGAEPGAGSR